MTRLRAKCPHCRTQTAVAIGPEYECHSCGRTFAAGLVRVPRAWGEGGDTMAQAALLPLPYPEAALVAEDSIGEQTLAVAADLPDRPLILGGCCCAHIGAVEALAARHGRVAIVWFDAHGDLNTPESSPSGHPWGMPLRTLLDGGTVAAEDVALVGARNLDPPEVDYIAESGLKVGPEGVEALLDRIDCVYVAVDCDALDPSEITPFMPEPDGLSLEETERLLERISDRGSVLGAGFSGLAADPANVAPLERLCKALRL